MEQKHKILFLCTGNICRSPTAEACFRYKVRAAGLGSVLRYDSAGTHGYHIGSPPDSRSIKVAASHGIDMADLRARKIKPSDYDDFDMILAMDRSHMDYLKHGAIKEQRAELHMFLDFVQGGDVIDVPDPYYGSIAGFEHVLQLIDRGCDSLLAHLRKKWAL